MKKILAAILTCVVGSVAAVHAKEPADPLAIPPGFELGGQFSDYRYKEPDVGVKLTGQKLAVTGAYTFTNGRQGFFKVDLRYAYGELDYKGSGTLDGAPDRNFETRFVIGGDFSPDSRGASHFLYMGLGYRYLYNDLRGTTSTGALGYRRYSTYWYVPLGSISRIPIGGQWVFVPTIEYDFFLQGEQISKLSDTGLISSNAYNDQNRGYGYRLSLMMEKDSWAFGLWMHYWNIKESDIDIIAPGLGVLEPKNRTREIGLEVKYRF